jgi:hypothetical protein
MIRTKPWEEFRFLFRNWNASADCTFLEHQLKEVAMGRGILLWLLGVPIPIIILLALFWH